MQLKSNLARALRTLSSTRKNAYPRAQLFLIMPMFLETFFTPNPRAFPRQKWHFRWLTTIRANGLVHLTLLYRRVKIKSYVLSPPLPTDLHVKISPCIIRLNHTLNNHSRAKGTLFRSNSAHVLASIFQLAKPCSLCGKASHWR
jgi:hypothetical protein